MQMIMFFVDSDASGATHVTRTIKRTRRAVAVDVDRPAPRQVPEVFVVDQRHNRLSLPQRLQDLDVSPEPLQAVAVHHDEEELERWDGLY